jgi:tetratricopeptide (TPR) repeat protein
LITDEIALNRIFHPRIESLRISIQKQVVASALKEAKRLQAAGKRDDAIAILEQARQMDKDGVLLDNLCVYLCDRASERIGQKKYEDAKKEFSHVLELKPGYGRAKQGMGTICNNQGCVEQNHDKAIALFEKALEWEPESYQVKLNLARELMGKAVSGVNNSPQYAIRSAVDSAVRLLERAYHLINTELKSGALDLIRQMSEVDSDLVKSMMGNLDNDVLKQLVENLGTVYHMQARIRRGY